MADDIYACDFETTIYDKQEYTEVWASAFVKLNTDDVIIHNSIDETFDYFAELRKNVVLYYHNIKFDGEFWLSFLMVKKNLKQAVDENHIFLSDNEMKNKTFKYLISDKGQWYNITIKINNHYIRIRDSLKLLPFSLRRIGKSFKTKHQKLEMEYKGFRYAGCEITDEEKNYIANDVLVLKEALEIMFSQGHKKLTIGSCCLSEFRIITGIKEYAEMFPDMTLIGLESKVYGSINADEYIRKSYRGGWCYVVKGKENKILTNGLTCDVNSLYPSVMHSESGNKYPIGQPTFWSGNYIPKEAEKKYYFIRIKTRFKIKNNMLPFIQLKRNALYNSRVCLTTSDIYDRETDKYYDKYYDVNGDLVTANPIITLTMTDYKLMCEHYDMIDTEILDGCYFKSRVGLFDDYIDKYKQIKITSTGALRELAKLFLNNLYGKMATSTDSSYKLAFLDENNIVSYTPIIANNKKSGYIPIGSAITSYAREFTIRTAQANYYGADKRGFVYADTDSIHCDLQPHELKNVPIHDTDFCHWKLESKWKTGVFVRPKTYVEEITAEGNDEITPYYNIKCAGMPEHCKNLLNYSMTNYFNTYQTEEEKISKEELYNKLYDVEKEFVNTKRSLKDFKQGLIIPSKLIPKRIKGGIILVNTTYEIR